MSIIIKTSEGPEDYYIWTAFEHLSLFLSLWFCFPETNLSRFLFKPWLVLSLSPVSLLFWSSLIGVNWYNWCSECDGCFQLNRVRREAVETWLRSIWSRASYNRCARNGAGDRLISFLPSRHRTWTEVNRLD